MRVIVDTSVLIALDRIGHIDLLRRLFGSVVRSQAVWEELLAGVTFGGINAGEVTFGCGNATFQSLAFSRFMVFQPFKKRLHAVKNDITDGDTLNPSSTGQTVES